MIDPRWHIIAMDPQLVKMLELRYQEDWTLARIAELLGLKSGAVDGRLRRALGVLRGKAGLSLEES